VAGHEPSGRQARDRSRRKRRRRCFVTIVRILFWVAGALIFYTLVGYPLLACILAFVAGRPTRREAIEPAVSFLISAYNEEAVIGEKIERTLRLEYTSDRLEVIVASDGSTDRTDEIVRSFAARGVRLFRSEGRRGKTHTLNGAVAAANGEVIVFSDA